MGIKGNPPGDLICVAEADYFAISNRATVSAAIKILGTLHTDVDGVITSTERAAILNALYDWQEELFAKIKTTETPDKDIQNDQ